MPDWQVLAAVQTSNAMAPVSTPNPKARMKVPLGPKTLMRSLPASAT